MNDKLEKVTMLQQQWAVAWKQACEWDNIPSTSYFVAFSKENPYQQDVNLYAGLVGEAIAEMALRQ